MSTKALSERALLWLLAAVQFTLLLDFMVMMPLGPELMQRLGLSASRFGALVSSYTLASATVGLSGLFWLNRVPRKPLLLGLYGAFALATLACALAPNAAVLLAARLLAGGAAGLTWAVILSLIVDVVPAERRGSALGLVMSSYAVCAVAGVPLGLLLSSQWSFRAPFLALCAVSVLLWLGAARWLPTTAPVEDDAPSTRELLKMPALWLAWLLSFLVVGAGFLLIPYLGTHMVETWGLRSRDLALVYLCGGFVTFFSSRVVGVLVDRYGPARLLLALLCASVAPHVLFTHTQSASLPHATGLFILFMTLTSGRMIPTVVLINGRVPPAWRTRFMAVNTAAGDAASGLATWVSGSLLTNEAGGRFVGFERSGWLAVCVTVAALGVLSLVTRDVSTTGVKLEADADGAA